MIKVKITKTEIKEEIIEFDGTKEELYSAIKVLNKICKEEYRYYMLEDSKN